MRRKAKKASFLNTKIQDTTWWEAIKGCTILTTVLTTICAAPFGIFCLVTTLADKKAKKESKEEDET